MIQSLLTQEEYDFYSKKYKTFNSSKRKSKPEFRIVKIKGKEFQCGPPPNYDMGKSLTYQEISIFNSRIDSLLEKLDLVNA